MNKKLLTVITAGTISFFSSNGVFGQEIAETLKFNKNIQGTEIIKDRIIDNLQDNKINKQEYEKKRNFIINQKKDNREFKKLIKEYIESIEQGIIQNPELRKREMEMLYFDCEFADIKIPHKLETLLKLSGSYLVN